MACFCVYNEMEWDDLTYCFNCRKAKTKQLKKKQKRIRYEKRRNKKYTKKELLKYMNRTTENIWKDQALLNVWFAFNILFENWQDNLLLEQLIYQNNIKSFMEFLHFPNVYHLSNIKSFKDGRIKSQYPDIYSEEKFVWRWSDEAIYCLRVLVGLTKFGIIDEGHMNAIYWHRDENEVKSNIKKLLNNQIIFSEIKDALITQIVRLGDNQWTRRQLIQTYDMLGLNFDEIFSKCLNF